MARETRSYEELLADLESERRRGKIEDQIERYLEDRWFSGDSVSTAHDLAMDVIHCARKGLPNFRRNCQLTSWLYRIARNVTKNFLETDKSAETQSLEELVVFEDGPISGTEILESREITPDRSLEVVSEATRVVSRLLEKVRENPELYLPLALRTADLSYKDIAEALNIPVSAVKTNVYRARELMRQWGRNHGVTGP